MWDNSSTKQTLFSKKCFANHLNYRFWIQYSTKTTYQTRNYIVTGGGHTIMLNEYVLWSLGCHSTKNRPDYATEFISDSETVLKSLSVNMVCCCNYKCKLKPYKEKNISWIRSINANTFSLPELSWDGLKKLSHSLKSEGIVHLKKTGKKEKKRMTRII